MADLLKRLKISEQQYGVGMEDNPFQDVSNDEAMKVCFGGGGGRSPPPPPPSTVTQQTSNIPEYFQPYLERLFERAEAVTTEPFQRYEGQRLATTTPQQQAAYQGVEEMVGGYKPYIATADLLTAQAAQQSTDPSAVAARMSPYQQAVIDIQKREALRDANKLQQQIGASAVGAGAFGGSRQALQESELARQTGQRLADIQAVGSQQAFQQAMNQLSADRAASLAAGQQFAGLGAQQQQLGLAGLGALETVGGTQQAQQQRALDIAYEDFAREVTRPSQQVQEMSSVLRGFNLPVSTYTTSQAQQAPPTFGQQAAGLGLGALGIYGAGKGVGLFAEGGEVPDNPGIKKLAAKAPQVVEKMGFDPQEVINAYMGGKMNYDNGGVAGRKKSRLGALDLSGPDELFGIYTSRYDDDDRIRGRRAKQRKEKMEEELKEQTGYDVTKFEETPVIPMSREMGKSMLKEQEKLDDSTSTTGTLPDGKVSYDTNVGGTDTGTDTATTNFTAPEVTPEPTVPQEDPYAYNKDLMNKYLAELFKEEEGIDIGTTAAALGMIQGIGGSREDIKAAQESAEKLAALQMGREKAEREALGKAVTMGLTREQMEREAARLDPYYEAKGEESRATAEALGAFGGSGEKLGKFRQDIAENILKTDYDLQKLQLQIAKAPAGSEEKESLRVKFNQMLQQRINEQVSILTGGKGSIENYLLKSKFRSPSGMGYSIDQPQPKG